MTALPIPVAEFLPELVVLVGALLVFLADTLGLVRRRVEVFGAFSLASLGIGIVLVLADLGTAGLGALRTLPASAVDTAVSTSALYAFTSLGLVFQVIFLLAAFLVSLASLSRSSDERGASIFFGLLLIATVGMMLATTAADLIFLLLAIEVTGISTYLLVGYTRKDARGIEAAMKFYIVGALSTAISFFGASLLFGAFGSTNLVVLAQATTPVAYPDLALVGYALLIAGVGFKLTLVPFHMWAVDVYDGAPTDVTAFLAGGSKKVGLFGFFLIFLGPVALTVGRGVGCSGGGCVPYNFAPTLQIALGIAAVLTMTVGNVLALLQKEMKRMLAYSSISQAGYMLLGIAIGTAPALAGATLQVFAHVFMKAGAFLVVAGVAGLGIGPLIDDWRGLGLKRPYLSVAFAFMLLSLAGIPLTIGFASKFVLFSSAVEAQGAFVWLAVAGLLNSALSVFYYARVLKVMFLDRPEVTPAGTPLVVAGGSGAGDLAVGGLGWGRAAAIGLAAVAIVAFGVDPQPVLSGIQSAATHFLATGA
ncbi:MAG TPA: NADH-quinone oxidoreductase subunit N [Thermoplasmata archaeon]|nr:NADH-quinone oxidoreductase subunit N [Thermoplasmata archaeon]